MAKEIIKFDYNGNQIPLKMGVMLWLILQLWRKPILIRI